MTIHLWIPTLDGAVCGKRLPHPELKGVKYGDTHQWENRHRINERFEELSNCYHYRAVYITCEACKDTDLYRNRLLQEELTR